MRKWETFDTAKAVIVIVHGAMEHQGRYGWLIEKWRINGYHVIVGDLPGHGLTTRSHRGHINSFTEYTDEVYVWIEEAKTYALPVFLLGHSMGGLTVIRLLQEREVAVDGIILSSPCLGLIDYPSAPLKALSVGLNWIAPQVRVESHLEIDLVTRSEDEKMRAMNDSLYVTKVSVRWYRELLKAMKMAFVDRAKFPDISLLLMQGGDDKIVNKQDVGKWFNELAISEKTYKEWQACYHEIFNEPEREAIFNYAKDFAETRLRMLGYVAAGD